MKYLISNIVIGCMMMSQSVNAKDSLLTKGDLSEIVKEAIDKYNIPAIAVNVMDSETIYFQEVQGVRVYKQSAKATLNDYFHIGSCSKSVVSVMAAKLVEQKMIKWNTRFFDIFPELLGDANVEYGDITLENLLLSEAGIKAFTNAKKEPLPEYDSTVVNKRLAFMKYLVSLPPSSEKRDGKFLHLYSNPSYMMASAMLERVTGLTYEELVHKTLMDDLGMQVYIGWPNSIDINQPWGHMISEEKVELFAPDHDYKIPYLLIPAGNLSMTSKDYARYTQLHLRGLRGVDKYLSTQAYHHIHFGKEGFSLGVANGSLGGMKYSAFDGTAGTFFCRSIIVPESDLAITIMMNAGSGTGSMEVVDWITMSIVKKHFNWWWKFWL